MSVRKFTMRSLAFAVAVAVVAPPLLAQQDTTRLRRTTSQTRINVSKGEVELRVDTVRLTRYDTVIVDRPVVQVRVDTVVVEAPPPPIVLRPEGQWYWSLFAGGTAPISEIDRLVTNSYHVGGAVGWDPRSSWFGARIMGSWTQPGREQGRDVALVGVDLPQMWQFAGDMKLKANFGGWSLYGLGGLGFNSYKRLPNVADFDEELDVDEVRFCETDEDGEAACYRAASDSWRTDFSWNFGVGTDFHIGRQDMFLEVRWNPISSNGAYTWYVPISLGLRYF